MRIEETEENSFSFKLLLLIVWTEYPVHYVCFLRIVFFKVSFRALQFINL